jgi:hypothetical protein
MPDVDLPSRKEQLWQKMQSDLAKFIPDVVDRNRLMCCACGRFLPPEHFDVDHIISQRAVKCDPEVVRNNPDTPTNIRAGTILLCTKPLHYRGARFYNNGCNSWKGKNFDGPLTKIFTGTVGQHRNKHAQDALIIGGLALAYLAMVAEFGYVVTLMQSGLALREQFFSPTRFRNGLGTKFKAIFFGSPHKEPDDPIWAHPFRFEIEDQSCLVNVRNFVIFLPLSRDPREPIARHLKLVPQRYAFRPNFETRFT